MEEEARGASLQQTTAHPQWKLLLLFCTPYHGGLQISRQQRKHSLSAPLHVRNTDELRRRAWPLLVGCPTSVTRTPYCRSSGERITAAATTASASSASLDEMVVAEENKANGGLATADVATIALDVARWKPPGGRSAAGADNGRRRSADTAQRRQERLADVIRRSLRTAPTAAPGGAVPGPVVQLRYYQGYHLLAALVVRTMGGGTDTGDDAAAAVAVDILAALGQSAHWGNALRGGDTLAPVQAALTESVVPLVRYFGPSSTDAAPGDEEEEVDGDVDADADGAATRRSLPWILTWFASGEGGHGSAAIAARLADAFVASHPLLPVYVAAVVLLQRRRQPNGAAAVQSYTLRDWDDIVDTAVDMMRRVPPRHLPKLAAHYGCGGAAASGTDRAAPPLSCATPPPDSLQHPPSPARLAWVRLRHSAAAAACGWGPGAAALRKRQRRLVRAMVVVVIIAALCLCLVVAAASLARDRPAAAAKSNEDVVGVRPSQAAVTQPPAYIAATGPFGNPIALGLQAVPPPIASLFGAAAAAPRRSEELLIAALTAAIANGIQSNDTATAGSTRQSPPRCCRWCCPHATKTIPPWCHDDEDCAGNNGSAVCDGV